MFADAKFLGGSKDGQTISVSVYTNQIVFPVPDYDASIVNPFSPPTKELTKTTFHHEVYRRVDADTFKFWGKD